MSDNKKAIDKEYLARQFYNFNKKYIKEDLKANKQNNLEVVSNHLTWKDGHILGINIDNDNVSKENYYISLKDPETGLLTWKKPIETNEDIKEDNLNLATAAAIYNFKGSENIDTIGEITKGSWNTEHIKIGGDTIKTTNAELDNVTSTNISANSATISEINPVEEGYTHIIKAKIDSITTLLKNNINYFVIDDKEYAIASVEDIDVTSWLEE